MRLTMRKTEILLWTAQLLLAALFTFAGGFKLTIPAEVMAAQSGMPGAFMHFIAACELLGAAGLVLPGLLRIKTELTPLAAAGLTIIMAGAVTTSLVTLGASAAIMPAVVGLMTAAVAFGRRDAASRFITLRPLHAA